MNLYWAQAAQREVSLRRAPTSERGVHSSPRLVTQLDLLRLLMYHNIRKNLTLHRFNIVLYVGDAHHSKLNAADSLDHPLLLASKVVVIHLGELGEEEWTFGGGVDPSSTEGLLTVWMVEGHAKDGGDPLMSRASDLASPGQQEEIKQYDTNYSPPAIEVHIEVEVVQRAFLAPFAPVHLEVRSLDCFYISDALVALHGIRVDRQRCPVDRDPCSTAREQTRGSSGGAISRSPREARVTTKGLQLIRRLELSHSVGSPSRYSKTREQQEAKRGRGTRSPLCGGLHSELVTAGM